MIVVDAFITRYPLIHPDWIFTRILGDQLSTNIAEERRLFYVALTRATTSLMIITESDAESSFLDPLKVTRRLQSVSWQTIPPLASAPGRFTIQVSDLRPKQEPGTFALKDLLKACGYEWHSVNRSRYWWRTCAAEGFDREGLKTEAWAGSVGGVEVRVLDHEDSLIESYLVRRGDWQKTR